MKAGWKIKPLGEVCEIKPKKKQVYNNLIDDDLVSFVPMSELGIDEKYFYPSNSKKLGEVYKGYTYFQNTDVILAKITPCFENGKLGIPNDLINGVGFGSSEFIPFRPNKNTLLSEFLYYFLNQESFRNKGVSMMKGAVGHKRIQPKFYENELIPIPPLVEQQQIVAILDKAFAAIDQAKANIEQNISNAEELFQSKLNAIFSQKGEGWEEKTLGEIGKVSMCKRILKKQTNTEKGIPFYKIGTFGKEANAFISEEIYNEFIKKYSFPKKGDVLISASGTIGRRVIYDGKPAYFQDSNIVWLDNNEEYVLNNFLYEFYGFCNWNPSKGATISRLYNDDLRKMIINFPNKKTQRSLILNIRKSHKKIQYVTSQYKQTINNLEELKKSLLQKAFAGELTNYATKAIDYPLKIQNISATDLHCGLIALAYQAHEKANRLNTFHHVKTEKIIHLIESHIGIDLERTPIKDAAGPNDFIRVRKKIEPRARKAGYFTVKKIDGAYHYFMGNQSEKLINKVISLLSKEQYKNIHHILGMMTKLDTQQAEIVATLYAAWNNLLLSEKEITDENIVFEARENWHKNKLDIERQRFFNALEWMKREENNLIPNGKGKLVTAQARTNNE